jgi:hypothetical protein
MTFSLDTLTAARIGSLSDQLGKNKSLVVREAVAHYKAHSDRVSEEERSERVRVFREFLQQVSPAPSHDAAKAELREIRNARRSGGRRTSSES